MSVSRTNIHRTGYVSTIKMAACPECDDRVPFEPYSGWKIDDLINHCLAHGYELLHLGTETSRDMGTADLITVAILGKPSS
jgi:hypothetical protein